MQQINHPPAPPDRTSVRKVLFCLDGLDNTKIGDLIVRLSEAKIVCHYFANARITINCPARLLHELAKNVTFIHAFTALKAEEIDFTGYDVILLYVDEQGKYAKLVARHNQETGRNVPCYRLNDSYKFEDRLSAAPLLEPLFQFDYPPELIRDMNRREIVLSDGEMAEGTAILDAHLRRTPGNEELILFIYSASAYSKTFRMSVIIELIRYFQALPGYRLVILDPFDDKEQYLRMMNVNIDEAVVLKHLSLRQTFSVMADPRMGLILGPCTGLMHAASGVYNSLVKRSLRTNLPALAVYTGLYEREGLQTAAQWWYGSLAKCLILKTDGAGNKRIVTLEEQDEVDMPFQKDVLPCREYTAALVQEYLSQHCTIGVPA